MSVSDEQARRGDWWLSHRGTGPRSLSGPGTTATPVSRYKFYYRRNSSAPAAISSRRLASALWQMAEITSCSGDVRWQCGLSDQLTFEFCSLSQIHNFEMEGVTKWDHGYSKTSRNVKLFDYKKFATISTVSSDKQIEFSRDRKRTNQPKVLEQQTLAILKNLADNVTMERKRCEKMHMLNFKLASDIAEANSLAAKYIHFYEKEKKVRKSLENVFIEINKRIEARRNDIRELKIERTKIREEMEKERKILQMAEASHEDQAQMKLVDASLILENEYCKVNNLIASVEAFLESSNT